MNKNKKKRGYQREYRKKMTDEQKKIKRLPKRIL